MLVWGLVLLYLFFAKKRGFSKALIAFMGANLAFVLADVVATGAIPSVRARTRFRAYAEVGRSAVAAAIWIPYFVRSRRVHATFVN